MKLFKTLALSLFMLTIPAASSWAVSVVSDPLNVNTAFCGARLDTGTRVNSPVAVAGTVKTCKIDISTVAVGTHTIDATAVPAVGTPYTESAPSAPLTFTRPAPPVTPTGLTLITVAGKPTVQTGTVAANVTICSWKLDGEALPEVAPVSGRCSVDVSPLTAGSYILTVAAAGMDTVWGRLESPASANFTYVVPTILNAPSGLKLAP
jgi:hypothetical protein